MYPDLLSSGRGFITLLTVLFLNHSELGTFCQTNVNSQLHWSVLCSGISLLVVFISSIF